MADKSLFPNLEGLIGLSEHDGVDVRPSLLRVLTDLYVQQPTHTPEEQQHYTELAMRLIDVVDVTTRITIAGKLASYPATPPAVVQRLARDVIEVAEPILIHSPCLTGTDLLTIIGHCGPRHAAAIAARKPGTMAAHISLKEGARFEPLPPLPAVQDEALPEEARKPEPTMFVLPKLDLPKLDLPKPDMPRRAAPPVAPAEALPWDKSEISRRLQDVADALGKLARPETPVPEDAAPLVPAAVPPTATTRADDIAAMRELGEAFIAAGTSERRRILGELATAIPAAIAEIASPPQTDAIRRLEQAALQHRPDEFMRELASALGISRDLARHIAADPLGELMVVALKAIGMPNNVAQRILLFANPAIGQSVERVFGLSTLYDWLDPEVARGLTASWVDTSAPPSETPAHRPLLWNDERMRRAAADQARRVTTRLRNDNVREPPASRQRMS